MNRNDEMVLKFREVLKETERLDAASLLAYQQSLLTPLLLHARTHSPFYARRLDPVIKGGEVDYSRWREIPILSRAEAQGNERAMHAAVSPPHLGPVSAGETSGSTGRPLRFLKSELMDVAGLAMTDRLCRWWKMDGDRTLAYIVSPRWGIENPEGVRARGWLSGHPKGRYLMRESTGGINAHLDWLESARPSYLVSYASMVAPLAETARVQNAASASSGSSRAAAW